MSITPIDKNSLINEEHEQLMDKMDSLIGALHDQVRAIDDLVRVVDEELVLLRESLDVDKMDDEDDEEPNTVTLLSGEKVVVK